jgi:hypothetical protein
MSAKVKLLSESEDMTIAANGNIIWIRDSAIWVNIKKFGFEAVRALVTRDSVFVLNRMEKSYSANALESLRATYNLPEGDVFDLLQRTLIGLPLIPTGGKLSSDVWEEKHRIRGEYNLFSAEYNIEEGSFSLKKEWFLRKKDQSLIALYFDRHQKIQGNAVLFPYFRRIETAGPETGAQTANLEFEDIQINTNPSFRFEIPGHYSKDN